MPTLIELLEAGVHFGHKKERSHPRAKDFIFTLREGVYVINLEKTQDCLEKALEFLKKQASLGKTILFVGTKRQARELVKSVATEVNMPYINQRWLGGTLTNFETIRKSLLTLEKLENQTNSPEFESLTKKEKKLITDQVEKLESTFGGVKQMKNLPDAIFIIDAAKEIIAINEANKVGIPVVAIADTDANPELISYPIPANDDAPKSIEMILGLIKEAVIEGQGLKSQEPKEAESEPETEKEVEKETVEASEEKKPEAKAAKKTAEKKIAKKTAKKEK